MTCSLAPATEVPAVAAPRLEGHCEKNVPPLHTQVSISHQLRSSCSETETTILIFADENSTDEAVSVYHRDSTGLLETCELGDWPIRDPTRRKSDPTWRKSDKIGEKVIFFSQYCFICIIYFQHSRLGKIHQKWPVHFSSCFYQQEVKQLSIMCLLRNELRDNGNVVQLLTLCFLHDS